VTLAAGDAPSPWKSSTRWLPITSSTACYSQAALRICFNRQKINLSQIFAGQTVGIKQPDERIWLVSLMNYDLGDFDDETCRLEPLANPFGPKVLPMCAAA
jgi:hypothetical protein